MHANESLMVGTKQVLRSMKDGELEYIYLAEDVEPFLLEKLKTTAKECGVEVRSVSTMKELGEYCKIDVGAACAGVRKA